MTQTRSQMRHVVLGLVLSTVMASTAFAQEADIKSLETIKESPEVAEFLGKATAGLSACIEQNILEGKIKVPLFMEISRLSLSKIESWSSDNTGQFAENFNKAAAVDPGELNTIKCAFALYYSLGVIMGLIAD